MRWLGEEIRAKGQAHLILDLARRTVGRVQEGCGLGYPAIRGHSLPSECRVPAFTRVRMLNLLLAKLRQQIFSEVFA